MCFAGRRGRLDWIEEPFGRSRVSDLAATVAITAIDHGQLGDGTTGARVSFSMTNTGARRIEDGEVTAKIWAVSQSGAAEGTAEVNYRMTALDIGATATHGSPLQIDPGTWSVAVYLFDAQSSDLITQSDPHIVQIAGSEAHQAAFAENADYAVQPHITYVEKVETYMVRVHYNLTNTGSVAVPPGLEVYGYINDQLSHADSDQDYHLQHGVAVGATDAHYLTLEGDPSPGQSWQATIYVDPNGPSAATSSVTVTWDEHGHASLTPA